MVTKYDVFEFVYTNRHPIKPIEVAKKFKKNESEYDNIHRLLTELTQDGLLVKTSYGFQAKKTENANILYQIIYHCLRNDINYNNLLNPGLANFISRALQKKEITSNDVNLHAVTLRKYIDILYRNGLLLIISEKPLRVKVFYGILLNNLLVYFGYKHKVVTEDTTSYLEEIEKELVKFRKLKRENEIKYEQIIDGFEISFIYHSLSLEGNPITLNETKRILKDKIIPANLKSKDIDEVKNYQKALLQMLKDSQDKKPLTLQTILDYHHLEMQHEPDIAGKIRKIEVYIKGNPNFKITLAKDIEEEFEKLIKKYNEFIKPQNPKEKDFGPRKSKGFLGKDKSSIKEILDFATYFHNEFQHIHPFADGNSRTTRLITFHLLQSRNIPIFDIPFGLLDEYLGYTKGSKKREDEKLLITLQKIILWNLKKINEMLS